MNKSKLVAALATAGFLCLGGTAAQAQSELWQGAWGQIGVGAATFIPGFSGGTYLNAFPSSGEKKDLNTIIGILSAGYTFAISGPWTLGVGASLIPGTSDTQNYSVLITTPRGVTAGPGTYSVSNVFGITLQPGYAINEEKLVYAKVGYSGATANTDSDSFGQASSSLSGYALGLGYRQVIRGGLYGYAELNYAKYNDVDVPYAQLSGKINATGMDVAVGIGWKF